MLSVATSVCNRWLQEIHRCERSIPIGPSKYRKPHPGAGGTGHITSPRVGRRWLAPILAQHYMQVVALNQPVPNHGTYLVVNSELNGDWTTVYVDCNTFQVWQ